MSFRSLFSKLRWFVAFLITLGLVSGSVSTATIASAAAPRNITYYKVSGPYLKNVDKARYKIGLYIPQGAPNNTYIGGTTLKQNFMEGVVTIKMKARRANSSRINIEMYESPFVSHDINASDTKRWITIAARSVRVGSKWKLVDPDTGKAYFWKVPGKAFKFQAKFDFTYRVYDGHNDVWVVADRGSFTTPVQTVAWVKKKPRK